MQRFAMLLYWLQQLRGQKPRTFNTKDLIADWEEIPGIDEVIERAKGCLTEDR